MGDPATGCRCGSGAHPRKCALHPELYRLHVAELNVEGYLPEDDADAFAAMDELLEAIREALLAERKRNATPTPPKQCAYFIFLSTHQTQKIVTMIVKTRPHSHAVISVVRYAKHINVDAQNHYPKR